MRCLLAALMLAGCASVSSPAPEHPTSVQNDRLRLETSDEVVRVGDELEVSRIAEHTYLVRHTVPTPANMVLAQMPNGDVVLVSTPFDTGTTIRLVAWIRATFSPSRIVAINTHFHFDGSGGNATLNESGVETYGSVHTAALVQERGPGDRAQMMRDWGEPMRARFEQMPIAPPSHTFSEEEGLTLAIGGEEVLVRFPGAAHSPDNVVTYFPARHVLAGGCMIKAGDSVGNLRDANLASWPSAIAYLRDHFADARIVVPGHGNVGGMELLDNTARVVERAAQSTTSLSP